VTARNERKEIDIQQQQQQPMEHEDSVPLVMSAYSQTELFRSSDGKLIVPKGKRTVFLCMVSLTEAETQVDHEEESLPVEMHDVRKSIAEQIYESINEKNKFQDLLTVHNNTFKFLLGMLYDFNPRCESKEVFLLAFLLKLKTALPFRRIGLLLDISESTISDNFYVVLEKIYSRGQKGVQWPNKTTVQKAMPNCFKQTFPNCRVILDCTEVRCERPRSTDGQFIVYSHYKATHTIKFLIGNVNLHYVFTIT
jgi:hypothetical protein